jgi:hypothetical protein
MSYVVAQQFDLISDDPRAQPSALSELREFWQASKELGGLLTQSQAAKILDIAPGSIAVWVQKGKLQTRTVAGVRMVGGIEITALLRQRQTEAKSVGGRGHKSASLADLTAAAREDLLSD